MKKNFNLYTICWLVILALFNIISFVSPAKIGELSKFTGSFWVGYVFITLSFIGQLLCIYKAFSVKTLDKLFLNIPLISISFTSLVVTLIAGGLFMAVPVLPSWIGIIICFAALGFSVISVIKACAAGDMVSDTESKIKSKTLFIKSLIVDVEGLLARVNDENIKVEIKKIYETVKYSDPMSSEGLSGIESQITLKFSSLCDAITTSNYESIQKESSEILILLDDRNKKFKLLK